jgi:hypothetical protein
MLVALVCGHHIRTSYTKGNTHPLLLSGVESSATFMISIAGAIDGEFGGHRYFECTPSHGLMLPVKANKVKCLPLFNIDDEDDDEFVMVEADDYKEMRTENETTF